MPGIDFQKVFDGFSLAEVLRLIGYQADKIIDVGTRGPCPFHCSGDARCCTLSWARDWWHCHRCNRQGKPFKLYMAYRGLTAFNAALELCRLLNKPVPWLRPKRVRGPWIYGRHTNRLDNGSEGDVGF